MRNICPYCGLNAVDIYNRPFVNCPRCGNITPYGFDQTPPYMQQPPYPPQQPYYQMPPQYPGQYQQHPYNQPPSGGQKADSTFSGIFIILGFTFSIVALFLCWIGIINAIFALPAAALSIVGAVQAFRRGKFKKLAVASLIIAGVALIGTTGFSIYFGTQQPSDTPSISSSSGDDSNIELAAKGLTAIQKHLDKNQPGTTIVLNRVMLIHQGDIPLVRIEMNATQGDSTRVLRFSISNDESMAEYGSTMGFWDDDLEVSVFDYTQPQAATGAIMLDIDKVVKEAEKLGYKS